MNYWEQSDKTLVDLTLLGAEKAYEELVIRWQGRVIGAATAILRDRYLAEDAAQDAFVSAWVKLDKLRDGEKFGAWVCRISRNRAKNMILRNSEMLSLDEAFLSASEAEENFDEFFSPSMDYSRLYQGISRLSERVRIVIQLHYIKGLSLAEISDQLQIPIGTVKYRLFDGREKLRKEMGILMKNEKQETFVEKVMKKVEEIKLWQLKDDKKGFEEFYREVLSDLEQLPDTVEKHYAMADVLTRGYWWLKDERNDELIARIRENAEKGRNEATFSTVLSLERKAFSGTELVNYMLEKQIPETQKKGFRNAEANTWFWLGYEYCRNLEEPEKGIAAYEKVLSLTTPKDVHYANAISAIQVEKQIAQHTSDICSYTAIAEEYRIIDGKLRFWSQPGYSRSSKLREPSASYVFYHASECDHLFYDPEWKVGDCCVGSDGVTTLTFLEDHATAKTACGEFRDCQIWEVCAPKNVKYRTYYKYNIGIVRQECNHNGYRYTYTLKNYHIAGGTGLLPLHAGNRWEYQVDHLSTLAYACENAHEILFFDGQKAVATDYSYCARIGMDPNNWHDVMLEMQTSYCYKDKEKEEELLRDVTPLIKRAKELAVTPYEKLHTMVACDVMERILRTDEVLNPALTEKGHWNFFQYFNVYRENGKLSLYEKRIHAFEWKDMKDTGLDGYPLLHNHIYTILQDAFETYLWDESFAVGTEKVIKQKSWRDDDIITTLSVKEAGSITTPAGTFENCILLDLHIKGRTGGWKYRGGKKEYYLAPGIGIVKAVNYYKERTRVSPYELTAYAGVGDGYFPMEPGMYRKYENLQLEKGFVSSAEYYCTQDNDGNTVLMANNRGTRKLDLDENGSDN